MNTIIPARKDIPVPDRTWVFSTGDTVAPKAYVEADSEESAKQILMSIMPQYAGPLVGYRTPGGREVIFGKV